MGKKKNRNALSPNAEGVRRGAGAEDQAPKALGVSMQLGVWGSGISSPIGSGRSPAAKRHLVNFLFQNAMQLEVWERSKLPRQVWAEPDSQTTLVHFGLKILYLARPSLAKTYAWRSFTISRSSQKDRNSVPVRSGPIRTLILGD